MQAAFKFEWTEMWEIATQSTGGRTLVDCGTGEGFQDDWVLDELRLDEVAFESVRQRALLRRLAANVHRTQPLAVDPAARRTAEQRLRTRLGLFRRSDLDRWCVESDLSPADLARLIDDEARLAEVESTFDAEMGQRILDQLRIDGDYGRLAARARDKRAVLAIHGQEDVSLADPGLTPIALVARHFETRLGRSIPDELDSYVGRLGFKRRADFYRALARERIYLQFRKVEADR
jgi:hypothetical protein